MRACSNFDTRARTSTVILRAPEKLGVSSVLGQHFHAEPQRQQAELGDHREARRAPAGLAGLSQAGHKAVPDVSSLTLEVVLEDETVCSFLDWLEHARSASEGTRAEYVGSDQRCQVSSTVTSVDTSIKGVRCSRVTVVERYKNMRISTRTPWATPILAARFGHYACCEGLQVRSWVQTDTRETATNRHGRLETPRAHATAKVDDGEMYRPPFSASWTAFLVLCYGTVPPSTLTIVSFTVGRSRSTTVDLEELVSSPSSFGPRCVSTALLLGARRATFTRSPRTNRTVCCIQRSPVG